MEERISAAEANRSFSKLLQGVREGRRYIVTSHGTPVAKIVPIEQDEEDAARRKAMERLLERVSRQEPRHVEPWTREELYDD